LLRGAGVEQLHTEMDQSPFILSSTFRRST
jgi:hypothetical protein